MVIGDNGGKNMDEKMSPAKVYLDVDTGEVLRLSMEQTTVKRPRTESETGWGMHWAAGLRGIHLPGKAWMVFWDLAANIDIETGVVHYNTRDMAESLGTPAPNISRSISQLVNQGMAQRIGHGRLRLNPLLVWRGPLSTRREVLLAMKADADKKPAVS